MCEAPCLGYSFNRHEEVLSLIMRSAPVTFWLAIGAFIIWIYGRRVAGHLAALRRGRWPDRLVMGVSLIGYSCHRSSSAYC
jgi:peptide/nickel transport system permease protein